MEHFVAYHSVKIRRVEYNHPGVLHYEHKKLKLLKSAIGNNVWLVQGNKNGKKTDFTLLGAYIADKVDLKKSSLDLYEIRGKEVSNFLPTVLLNDLSWFADFKKGLANFQGGFKKINDEKAISALITLQSGIAKLPAK